ncbi:hypothetical protein NQ315_015183 [Exocentrus adspersus]|uniref:Insulin-like domain-containing protein n=1 Tax=Exocentrus adspersus TaxID=1586481 RepID=A0AAV8VJH3_9CUCU|nr:hypothetical protein NQ315_015183 [Exocentrus adspersus]
MNCKVIFMVLINILYVCSSSYFHDLMTKRTRYCGSHLTTTLSLVCGGRYPTADKKSLGYDLNFNEYDGEYNDVNDDLEFPFMSKELAKSLVPQKARRGVYNECCQKPCSMKELRYYCAE